MDSTNMLSAVLVVVCLAVVDGQTTYSRPIDNIDPQDAAGVCFQPAANTLRVLYVADMENSCWYWECRRMRRNIILQPRNCALGRSVSDFFLYGSANPCTEGDNNNRLRAFSCSRQNLDIGPPPCVNEYTSQGICKNGGRVVYTYSTCSCDCIGTGFADWDCSERPENLVGASPIISPDDPCPGGVPRNDWCQAATVNGQSPCLNNGQCRNQCLNYVCICIPPFTAGRNCELVQCSENLECLNGGTCDRGPSGMNRASMCLCPPGTSGARCKIRDSS